MRLNSHPRRAAIGALSLGIALAGLMAAPSAPGPAAPAWGAGLVLSSPAFADGGQIPVPFTCAGENVSPPLQWTTPPPGTLSFALLAIDPDAPGGEFVHWVLYDIPLVVRDLRAGLPPQPLLGGGIRQGTNDFDTIGYGGPCPPRGLPHRYVFTLYALNTPRLPVPERPIRRALVAAMNGRVLATAILTGRFQR